MTTQLEKGVVLSFLTHVAKRAPLAFFSRQNPLSLLVRTGSGDINTYVMPRFELTFILIVIFCWQLARFDLL